RLRHHDRLHANSEGHRRIADAAAEVLGLPGATADWRVPLPEAQRTPAPVALAGELVWMGRHMAPWVGRRLRGRSSGDGVLPKRPRLSPVGPP
ncbi:MAG: SGNH/GDSL hydrolase family protein, partial [Solirubrobacteraceae bacterium]